MRLIAEQTRVHDLACRMGGDEFGFLLPETGAAAAQQAIERILVELEDLEAGGIRGVSVVGRHRGAGDRRQARVACSPRRGRLWSRRAPAAAGRPWSSVAPQRTATAVLELGHGDVIAALASALQERDRYTGDHSETRRRPDRAGRRGARRSTARRSSRIRTAALLHDIGKIGVPGEILHKPGPLTVASQK